MKMNENTEFNIDEHIAEKLMEHMEYLSRTTPTTEPEWMG